MKYGEGGSEGVPERSEIITLLNTLHPEKIPKLKTAEANAQYSQIATTLSQVLTELLTDIKRNKRFPNEFSRTWKGKDIHLIYINTDAGKLSAQQYTLSTPKNFLTDASAFLKNGSVAQRSTESPRSASSTESGSSSSRSTDQAGGQREPYRSPYERREGESGEEYFRRTSEYDEQLLQELLRGLEQRRNIHFNFDGFPGSLNVFRHYRVQIVNAIAAGGKGLGAFGQTEDLIMNSVIKINGITNGIVVERKAGTQTIYVPYTFSKDRAQYELVRILKDAQEGKDPALTDDARLFHKAKALKEAYRLSRLTLENISTADTDMILHAWPSIMTRLESDASRFEQYEVEFSNHHNSFAHSGHYMHSKQLTIVSADWKQGEARIEALVRKALSEMPKRPAAKQAGTTDSPAHKPESKRRGWWR